MPDKDGRTIQDLIYYQYAKIIAIRAFTAKDGMQAKKLQCGLIEKTFKELWSPRTDLNRQPADYKSAALPLSYVGRPRQSPRSSE